MSIKLNVFPCDWKVARVSPIFKAGERNDTNNYRPISVLWTVPRIFERLIYEQFYSYLNRHNLLNQRQSGFRSLHSTVTAVLDLTNQWCFNIDRGMISGVIFLDLKKAFDTVDHNLLLTKLKHYGMQEKTLQWFRSYLSDRSQRVYINGILSDKEQITCGVPQGSTLGPLLFLIYINDLSSAIDFATTRMYADDSNLTYTACGIPTLQYEMKRDIERLKDWLTANKLTLNILKSEVMLVGSRQRIATITENINLSINGISLMKVDHTKCLGVLIDEHLTWNSHLTSVAQNVSSGICVFRRAKPDVANNYLIDVYRSIIEPYFDCCCIVWDGIGEGLANKLQKLQNHAARIIIGAHYMTPSKEVLSKLGWAPLEERRNKLKAVMMFKIVNGLAPAYLNEMFQGVASTNAYNLRSSNKNLALPKARTDYYRKSFAFTGAKIWNGLPQSLKEEQCLETFKTKLKSLDLLVNI